MISLIYINTQEWIRLKFLQVVFFLAFIYVCLSYLLASLSFTEQVRIKYDLGLAGLEIASLFISAFISTHALARDMERKTFQVILARPIARWHLLVGYLGSILILNSILVCFMCVTMFIFFPQDYDFFNLIIIALTLILKATAICAFGIMLSTIARPMFSLVMTMSYWVLLYSVSDIRYFVRKTESSILAPFSYVLDYIGPQFYLYNWKSYHDLNSGFDLSDVIWAWSHCLGWIFLYIFIASLLIRRKDIV